MLMGKHKFQGGLLTVAIALATIIQMWTPTTTVLLVEASYPYLNITQIIQQYGYQAEEHQIATDDGWLLGVQRLLPTEGTTKRGAVLLQHGLFDSAYTFVANLPHQSLAYLLGDQGFDVWLANSRGNTWSMRNLRHPDPNSTAFWNFTWDEMALHDLPAMVDYILAVSGVPTVGFVGHSQGGIIGLAALSRLPQYQRKISIYIGLAPAVYEHHNYNPSASLPTELLYEIIGRKGFAQSADWLRQLLYDTVVLDPPLAADIICRVGGCVNTSNYNVSAMPQLVLHFPAGTSTKDLGHFQQQVRTQIFRMYDYGLFNWEFYGQFEPPVYPLENIPASYPLAVFYSLKDQLVNASDVLFLLQNLPSTAISRQLTNYGHTDFVWGLSASQEIYPEIIQLLIQHSSSNHQPELPNDEVDERYESPYDAPYDGHHDNDDEVFST